MNLLNVFYKLESINFNFHHEKYGNKFLLVEGPFIEPVKNIIMRVTDDELNIIMDMVQKRQKILDELGIEEPIREW